jgi:hypothetical protein
MRHFEQLGDAFGVARGAYAVVAQDWSGMAPHPCPGHEHGGNLRLPPTDRPVALSVNNLEMLVLPAGRDSAGCKGRSIAIGRQTIVAFERLAIVALETPLVSPIRHTSDVDQIARVVVPGAGGSGGIVRPVSGGYALEGFDDGVDWIDTRTPGAFRLESEFFDMAHAQIAAIFGYGTEAFNAALDAWGFHCNVKALRERLINRSDPEALSVLGRLPPSDTARARYAQVIP